MNTPKTLLEKRLKEIGNFLVQAEESLGARQEGVSKQLRLVEGYKKEIQETEVAIELLDAAGRVGPMMGQSQLEYYKKHPVEWIERFLDMKLAPYQKQALEDARAENG